MVGDQNQLHQFLSDIQPLEQQFLAEADPKAAKTVLEKLIGKYKSAIEVITIAMQKYFSEGEEVLLRNVNYIQVSQHVSVDTYFLNHFEESLDAEVIQLISLLSAEMDEVVLAFFRSDSNDDLMKSVMAKLRALSRNKKFVQGIAEIDKKVKNFKNLYTSASATLSQNW